MKNETKILLIFLIPKLNIIENLKLKEENRLYFSYFFDNKFVGYSEIKINDGELIIDIFDPLNEIINNYKHIGLGSYSYLLLLKELMINFKGFKLKFITKVMSEEYKLMIYSFGFIEKGFFDKHNISYIELKNFYNLIKKQFYKNLNQN